MNEKPVAVITGAAQGIGLAAAVEFARRGYNLALVDIKAKELGAAAKFVNGNRGSTMAFAGDLADFKFAEGSVRKTVRCWGRIDVLVNNAAWRELKTMREITAESWEKTLRVCLTVPAFLSRWAAEVMVKQREGVIINISSIRAIQPERIAPAYVAAKAGLDALTGQLATLYGPAGIRVVSICPGAVASGLSLDRTDRKGRSMTRQFRQFTEDCIPLRRWGDAAEIARAIAFVASKDASYVTGTRLVVDGGWLCNGTPYGKKPERRR